MRVRIRALPRALRVFLVLAVVYWVAGAATIVFDGLRTLSADATALRNVAAAVGLVGGSVLFVGTLLSLRYDSAQQPARWLGAAPVIVVAFIEMLTSDFAELDAWFWFTGGVLAWTLIEFLSAPRRETLTPMSGVPRVERPIARP